MALPKHCLSQINKLIEKEREFQSINSKLPLYEKVKDFDDRIKNMQYWKFVEYADYHYFVSRILFLNKVFAYSMYCANQCIENYLKAYLKMNGIVPRTNHGLIDFRDQCCRVSKNPKEFIHTRKCLTIIKKYQPFEEYSRYPVSHFRPGPIFVYDYPNDIFLLDFFIFSMRLIIPNPTKKNDILLENDHFLNNTREEFPNFFSIFQKDNLNFENHFPEIEIGHEYINIRVTL